MKRAFPALLALLCATLALLIATSSSPLYAANFWTDTNIYFTIGRGMTRGLMPYRDLFDHKGPLLFMLYALGAAISDTSFIGVFALEVLSLAAAVYAGWRTVSLFGEGRLTLLSMPILAAVVCCCTAFTQGGSAEEFALPALAAGVYLALALMARPGEADGRRALGFGAAAGWVFLIKYTDIGLFAGLGIGLLAFVWRREGFGRTLASAGRMLLGALLVCAPVAAYLAANGALGACVEVYFIQNLFDYSGAPMSLSGHVYNALAYLRTQSAINPAVVLLVALGMAFLLLWAAKRHEKGMIWQALALPMGAGLLLLTCYWGEMAHPYYALVFAGLCAPGLIPLAWLAGWAEKRGLLARAGDCAGLQGALPRRAADAGEEGGHGADGLRGDDEPGGSADAAGHHQSGSGVLSGGGDRAKLPVLRRQQFADAGKAGRDCVVSGRGKDAVCRDALCRPRRGIRADRRGRRCV